MAAILTNASQLQVQYHFQWRGADRYINEEYMPNELSDVWSTAAVLAELVQQISSGTVFESTFHEDLTLVSVKGTARGDHPQVLVPVTQAVGLVGGITGFPTPRWFTFNVFQQPDNAQRYVITSPQSIFQPGRMAFPGVPGAWVEGDTLSALHSAQFIAFANLMLSIPDGANPTDAPAMSCVMTRKRTTAPYSPLQRANVLGVYPGVFGHQDTARA